MGTELNSEADGNASNVHSNYGSDSENSIIESDEESTSQQQDESSASDTDGELFKDESESEPGTGDGLLDTAPFFKSSVNLTGAMNTPKNLEAATRQIGLLKHRIREFRENREVVGRRCTELTRRLAKEKRKIAALEKKIKASATITVEVRAGYKMRLATERKAAKRTEESLRKSMATLEAERDDALQSMKEADFERQRVGSKAKMLKLERDRVITEKGTLEKELDQVMIDKETLEKQLAELRLERHVCTLWQV